MNQKNEKKVTGDLFGTPSRTQLTLNIEQVLLFVEFLFSIIMEDITKQKKKHLLGKRCSTGESKNACKGGCNS